MSAFHMGATPVTWGMWKEYCKAKSVRMPDEPDWGYIDNHPVVNVSWEGIMNPGGFCEWANDVAGFRLSLPTEAQFEYANRGVTEIVFQTVGSGDNEEVTIDNLNNIVETFGR
jgi:formylglycine-generating enzyme required for sulfatase activity